MKSCDTAAETCPPWTPPSGAGRGAALENDVLRLPGGEYVVRDTATHELHARLRRLARSDLTVVLMGETGSGKEVAAEAVHAWSHRSHRTFLAINCAALPESLIESELFGFQRGAFSGATSAKEGLLESAAGGTVLLDEIGELPLTVQAKLLRVLETRAVVRLGSVQPRALDVRIVAATNRDLRAEVAAQRFRADLFFRLSGAVVHVPPLRARPLDIPVLARRFLHDACAALGRPTPRLEDQALSRLGAHHWPGNVRELKHMMICLAATHETETIAAEQLSFQVGPPAEATPPPELAPPPAPAPARTPAPPHPFRSLGEAVLAFERHYIGEALRATGGHKTRAARLLKVPLRTFMTKVRRHSPL
jgi:two-component system response regulator AtoC